MAKKLLKKTKALEPEVEVKVEEPKLEVVKPVLPDNTEVIEINGRKFYKIFNPLDGTTRKELIR